jgi:hypothetical protein
VEIPPADEPGVHGKPSRLHRGPVAVHPGTAAKQVPATTDYPDSVVAELDEMPCGAEAP